MIDYAKMLMAIGMWEIIASTANEHWLSFEYDIVFGTALFFVSFLMYLLFLNDSD